MLKWISAILAGAVVLSPVMAQAADALAPGTTVRRLCKEADILGSTFTIIDLTETPDGTEEARFKNFPYQYLTFNADHTFGVVFAQHAVTGVDEMKREMRI